MRRGNENVQYTKMEVMTQENKEKKREKLEIVSVGENENQ